MNLINLSLSLTFPTLQLFEVADVFLTFESLPDYINCDKPESLGQHDVFALISLSYRKAEINNN